MNELLPGFNRPSPQVTVVDRQMLRLAQQSARQRKNWQCANELLKKAYDK